MANIRARTGRAAAWKHVLATEFVHILLTEILLIGVIMELTILLEHLRHQNLNARWPHDIADKVYHLYALNCQEQQFPYNQRR